MVLLAGCHEDEKLIRLKLSEGDKGRLDYCAGDA